MLEKKRLDFRLIRKCKSLDVISAKRKKVAFIKFYYIYYEELFLCMWFVKWGELLSLNLHILHETISCICNCL